MGIVYEARQISLDRRVALKVLPFAAALDPRQLQRFKTEAQAAAHLHHSNIVPVFAIGCEQALHYYAMQYIEGQSLASVIEEIKCLARGGSTLNANGADHESNAQKQTRTIAALSTQASSKSPHFFGTVARLGVQAAEALAYAHQFGVVHRDIKPANLLVDLRGNLWITDFGLARFLSETGQTGTGDLVGTLRYMSPEQAQGKPGATDDRTDIYGLGATLYELLTLQPVFTAGDRNALLWQIAWEEATPPRRLHKSIPVELETIVLKALAKSPDERYATAQEMADDLRRFLSDTPILAKRPSLLERGRKWARRHKTVMRAAAAMLLMAVTCLAVSTVLIARQRDEAEARRRQARTAVDEMYSEVAQNWLAHQPYLEPLQEEFLLKALRFYKDFARENGTDPGLRLETAKAEHHVAYIQHRLGLSAAAEPAYGRAIALLEALSAEFPGPTEYRAELAQCHNDWGNWLRDRERWTDAEQSYRRALALFGELALEDPDQPGPWDGLAGCSNNLGVVLAAGKRLQDAEKAYHHALTVFTRLVADHPDLPAYRHDLASSQNNLANLLRDAGRLQEAEKYYDQALLLWNELTGKFPERALYRQSLASALQGNGILLASVGRLQEADQHYRRALLLRERLADDFPSIPVYRLAWAVTLNRLGLLLANRNRTDAAENAHRKALKLLKHLATDYPEVPAYTTELIACQKYLGALHDNAAGQEVTEQRRGNLSPQGKGQSK
jgi:tetratricopeptide (TPR) repeat protein